MAIDVPPPDDQAAVVDNRGTDPVTPANEAGTGPADFIHLPIFESPNPNLGPEMSLVARLILRRSLAALILPPYNQELNPFWAGRGYNLPGFTKLLEGKQEIPPLVAALSVQEEVFTGEFLTTLLEKIAAQVKNNARLPLDQRFMDASMGLLHQLTEGTIINAYTEDPEIRKDARRVADQINQRTVMTLRALAVMNAHPEILRGTSQSQNGLLVNLLDYLPEGELNPSNLNTCPPTALTPKLPMLPEKPDKYQRDNLLWVPISPAQVQTRSAAQYYFEYYGSVPNPKTWIPDHQPGIGAGNKMVHAAMSYLPELMRHLGEPPSIEKAQLQIIMSSLLMPGLFDQAQTDTSLGEWKFIIPTRTEKAGLRFEPLAINRLGDLEGARKGLKHWWVYTVSSLLYNGIVPEGDPFTKSDPALNLLFNALSHVMDYSMGTADVLKGGNTKVADHITTAIALQYPQHQESQIRKLVKRGLADGDGIRPIGRAIAINAVPRMAEILQEIPDAPSVLITGPSSGGKSLLTETLAKATWLTPEQRKRGVPDRTMVEVAGPHGFRIPIQILGSKPMEFSRPAKMITTLAELATSGYQPKKSKVIQSIEMPAAIRIGDPESRPEPFIRAMLSFGGEQAHLNSIPPEQFYISSEILSFLNAAQNGEGNNTRAIIAMLSGYQDNDKKPEARKTKEKLQGAIDLISNLKLPVAKKEVWSDTEALDQLQKVFGILKFDGNLIWMWTLGNATNINVETAVLANKQNVPTLGPIDSKIDLHDVYSLYLIRMLQNIGVISVPEINPAIDATLGGKLDHKTFDYAHLAHMLTQKSPLWPLVRISDELRKKFGDGGNVTTQLLYSLAINYDHIYNLKYTGSKK